MSVLKYVKFDDLIGMNGVNHFPSTKEILDPIHLDNILINDVPDDYIVLENALIVDRGGIIWRDYWISDDIHYFPPDWREAPWLPGIFDRDSQTISMYNDQVLEHLRTDESLFYVDSTVGCNNFGHFVHDSLPYGQLFKKIKSENSELKPALWKLKYYNQKRLFDYVFDYKFDESIPLQPGLRVNKLFLARRQNRMDFDRWSLSFNGLRAIRDSVISNISDNRYLTDTNTSSPLKIYLARIQDNFERAQAGLLQGRDFANYEETLNFFMRNGFISFEPGLLPVEHIADLISKCDKLFSVHGAGLANLIFARKDTLVVELRGFGGNWRSLEAMSAVLEHRFVGIVNELSSNGVPEIDFKKLREYV